MKECPDDGRLQSFYDGELPADMMEETARHIASCIACSEAARELESENATVLRALEPELSAGVPSERLRLRLNAAVAEMNSPARPVISESPTGSRWLSSLAELFRLTPQGATAFASILAVILLGSVFAAVMLRTGRDAGSAPAVKGTPPATVSTGSVSESEPDSMNPPITIVRQTGPRSNRARPADAHSPAVKLIPGEESYLRTIAGLDVGLKGGHRSMSPTTRAEYERNLKLVDYAIAATRSRAKQSPHDPDAAGFMFAAYQSKIDLLSTMSETARLTPH